MCRALSAFTINDAGAVNSVGMHNGEAVADGLRAFWTESTAVAEMEYEAQIHKVAPLPKISVPFLGPMEGIMAMFRHRARCAQNRALKAISTARGGTLATATSRVRARISF